MTDLEGLAPRLDRLAGVEAASHNHGRGETEPWIECVVEDDRLGPRILLVIAIHRAGVSEVIPVGDGEYRVATRR